MIDSHCHLNATYTTETVGPILQSFFKQGGECVVDVTTTENEFENAMQIAQKFPGKVYTTIGVHPEECHADNREVILTQARNVLSKVNDYKNIVGIGETGIDLSYLANETGDVQKILDLQEELLNLHIETAIQTQLPLVIHARGENFEDFTPYHKVIDILESYPDQLNVYFHSFGGDVNTAKRIIDKGYFIGVNGIVTYSKAEIIAQVVTTMPLTQMLLETDSPYLIPSNMDRALLKDKSINEPSAIFFTAKRIATLKKIAPELILEQTSANAKRFFNFT